MRLGAPMRRLFALACLFFAPLCWAVSFSGQDYIPLRTAAARLGLKTAVQADGKDVVLQGARGRVEATLHQRQAKINGTNVWLALPVAEAKERFYISQLDYERTLLPLLKPENFTLSKNRLRHIVLDPGHGGKDTGAQNKALRVNEKTFTLDVAERVKQQLEALGYRVTLTRREDRFVELRERPRLANALHADLFVSIHFNSAEPAIRGIETYCYTPQGAPSSSRAEAVKSDREFQPGNQNDVSNLVAAYEVQKALVSTLRSPDRAVRRARFAVLEDLNCPGILVEGGYISSPSEGARLSSALYRQQVAQGIVQGIRNYHRRILGM